MENKSYLSDIRMAECINTARPFEYLCVSNGRSQVVSALRQQKCTLVEAVSYPNSDPPRHRRGFRTRQREPSHAELGPEPGGGSPLFLSASVETESSCLLCRWSERTLSFPFLVLVRCRLVKKEDKMMRSLFAEAGLRRRHG